MTQRTIFDLLEKDYKPTDENDTYLGQKCSGYCYKTYIQSYAWRKKRDYALKVLGEKCQECDKADVFLQVHHKHYKTLYHERLEDVKILCKPCHDSTHKQIDIKREEKRYDNAFYTWVEKKYGEDAHEFMDMELLGEEFQDWMERKENDFY